MKRRKKKRRRSNSGERGPGKSGQAGRREHSKSVGGQKIVTMPQAGAKAAKSDGIKKKLPIRAFRREILKTVAKNPTVVLVGETGSGKTTQLPQYIYKGGLSNNRMVAVTQPRRVAAMSVSKRVASEMRTDLGAGLVGYAVRFDNKTSSRTAIKYMTDGLLLREALLDPWLSRYSTIILDEAHERIMHTDILFGIVKEIQKERNKKGKGSFLRVIVMSATLQTEMFSKYFDNAPILRIPGRTFPVDVYYASEAQNDYVDAALTSTLQIHFTEPRGGDILVFLPGQEDIENLYELLTERASRLPASVDGLLITPIYAALPPEKQMLAFAPTPDGMRKIVLATNIAETSITIDGICYVVDPGFVKVKGHLPRTGMEYLRTVPTSKAQAWQRAGRAGRQSKGKCFRLYPEPQFEGLEDVGKSEIHRASLTTLVLQLKALGVHKVEAFDFIEPPPVRAIRKAISNLTLMQALEKKTGKLTALGKRLAELPLEPRFGLLLLKSTEEDFMCSKEILTIISMLSAESIFYSPNNKREIAGERHKRFAHELGDHLTLLNVYEGYLKESKEVGSKSWCRDNFINGRSVKHALKIRHQIKEQLLKMRLPIVEAQEDEKICKCLVAGCYLSTARLNPDGKGYKTTVDQVDVQIHPTSVLFRPKVPATFVVYVEMVKTKKKYIRCMTVAEESWLMDYAAHCFGRHG